MIIKLVMRDDSLKTIKAHKILDDGKSVEFVYDEAAGPHYCVWRIRKEDITDFLVYHLDGGRYDNQI